MTITTTWTTPSVLTSGRDHLATNAVCEVLYAQLLPGITNVTDRARYYSLYPWLLWTMDQASVPAADRDQWFRRADCLLTLVGLHHGEGDEHWLGAVGSRTLGRALAEARADGTPIDLSRWATRDDVKDRYFKSRRGGLGQYYQGSLEAASIGLLARDAEGALTWAEGIGEQIAERVDASVDRQRFIRCVTEGTATLDDLAALDALCLCRLSSPSPDRDPLLEVFWPDSPSGPGAKAREQSLRLITTIARDLDGVELSDDVFRAVVTTRHLPGGVAWNPPDAVGASADHWRTYVRSEWLSLAVQGVFFATLESVVGVHPNRRALATAALEELEAALTVDLSRRCADAIEGHRDTLPPLGNPDADGHELALLQTIRAAKDASTVLDASVRLLLALAARHLDEDPLGDFSLSDTQRRAYPVNLNWFAQMVRGPWAEMLLRDVLLELMADWGVGLHLRVALRKLHQQTNDTFQIRPNDFGHLRVELVPEPAQSNPRLKQTVQILRDLRVLGPQPADGPTPLGVARLEVHDG